jgi:hypothetical protein
VYNKNMRSKKSICLGKSSGNKNCDLCGEKNFLEVHHINGRKVEDAEKPYNLTSICSSCHTKVHMGAIIIEQWLMTTNGLKLFWHKKEESSITGQESKPYIVPIPQN